MRKGFMADRPIQSPTSTRTPCIGGEPRLNWQEAMAVSTHSVVPAVDVAAHPSDWVTSVLRAAKPELLSAKLPGSIVGAVSLPLVPARLNVFSVQFPETGGWRKRATEPTAAGSSAAQPKDPAALTSAAKAPARTRIKPPGDVIKLEDRLFYVLQPSLETLIGEGSLAFPCHPFPYQFEGVAFLYPRYGAILADEMGLGKSMQAITAMRLFLHAGQGRSGLCIVPKPLLH